ncbi:HAMP domain-containing protein [Sorangium sp. So ce1335]|uniref:HAMP domain-containing protein n=1 Tax=Sorangium sp. So ce1335 TaxID=3133335 RepID=UPI003F6035D4
MSDASSTAPQTSAPEVRARYQRSARNYLLDQKFQLKYTGFLVGISLALSVALGVLLWNASSKIIEQSRTAVQQGQETVRQGQETVKRGQEVLVQSRRVSEVVAMNIAKEYKDDPELAKTFGEAAQRDESKLKDEQARLERDAATLQQRAEALERQAAEVAHNQQMLLRLIVALLSLLVLGVGVAGIVFTHKIAGPIFKMKRLLRQVGEGKLVVRERLRKGDELQHFFEAFEKMVEDLRARQQAKIAKMDAILEKIEADARASKSAREVDAEGLAQLRRLRSEMQEQLDA